MSIGSNINHFMRKNKEMLIVVYVILFILGFNNSIVASFYNEFRILEIFLLLFLVLYSTLEKKYFFTKYEFLFFIFMIFGYFFWNNNQFVIIEMLLVYLLYKNFHFLNYNEIITKVIIFASFFIFVLFPVHLLEYVFTGVSNDWHPLPWNRRVYNSYFLIISIFAVWFFIEKEKYKIFYLIFIFLAFLSILLEGGRSATLAFTVFIMIVCAYNRLIRWKLACTYGFAWLSYISITYFAKFNITSLTASTSSALDLQIVRTTSSLRYDLWINAYQCWLTSPVVGCGFYQLDGYAHLAAHPHNLFIQVVSETGLIGFCFLALIVFTVIKNIEWRSTHSYFIIAALLTVGIDMSLSGVHVYPITQIVLLWLFVFLLKNSAFSHSQYFTKDQENANSVELYLSVITYIVLIVIFFYFFMNSIVLSDSTVYRQPRFWENGYQLW